MIVGFMLKNTQNHRFILLLLWCLDTNIRSCSGTDPAFRLSCSACLNDLPVFDSSPLRCRLTSFPGSELPPTKPGTNPEEDADLPVTGHNVSDTAELQQPLLHLVMCLHQGAAMFAPTSSTGQLVYIYAPEAETAHLRWRQQESKKVKN